MSVPSSSPTHLTGQDGHPVHLSSLPRTRTVAIVKKHALHNRLDIEPRIFEAGFEVRQPHSHLVTVEALNSSRILQIVKERQMEFDMESDPEVMYDLFGDDAACFAECAFHHHHPAFTLITFLCL
jgi:hypothetical protein